MVLVLFPHSWMKPAAIDQNWRLHWTCSSCWFTAPSAVGIRGVVELEPSWTTASPNEPRVRGLPWRWRRCWQWQWQRLCLKGQNQSAAPARTCLSERVRDQRTIANKSVRCHNDAFDETRARGKISTVCVCLQNLWTGIKVQFLNKVLHKVFQRLISFLYVVDSNKSNLIF